MTVVANMFSVPLGILFGADVSSWHSPAGHVTSELKARVYLSLPLPSTFASACPVFVHFLSAIASARDDRLLTGDAPSFANRSLIAAYIGNIVGALFVALPALYFFGAEYREAVRLRTVEAGEVEVVNQNSTRTGSTYEDEAKRA